MSGDFYKHKEQQDDRPESKRPLTPGLRTHPTTKPRDGDCDDQPNQLRATLGRQPAPPLRKRPRVSRVEDKENAGKGWH
jgi:hypothetical protein